MAEMIFTNNSYLWLLTLVPFIIAIHFFTLRHARTALIKFSNFEAIQRVSRGDVLGSPYKGVLRNKSIGMLILRALVYCLLILSVAGTTLLYEGKSSNFDFIIAVDASSSMLADDFKPSRLEAAKEAANKFVDAVPSGSKIGLVTFASTALTNLRLTQSRDDAKDAIFNIELLKTGGTAIGDAIVNSINTFDSASPKSKAIVLITDGQNNVGISPEAAVEYAKQNAVTVHSIGMATKEGGTISALNLVSKLDEDVLKKISQNTNGMVFVANSTENLDYAFNRIVSSTKSIVSLNISWILLLSAIALLGLEWILINTLYKTLP